MNLIGLSAAKALSGQSKAWWEEFEARLALQIGTVEQEVNGFNGIMTDLLNRIDRLERIEQDEVKQSGGGDVLVVAKESFSGTTSQTKSYEEDMYGFILSNDGDSDISFTISGQTYTVRSGEVFESNFEGFKTIDIVSNNVPYRAIVNTVLGNLAGLVDEQPEPVANLIITRITPGSLSVAWGLSTSGDILNYEVSYSSDGMSYSVASNTVTANSTVYTINNLSPDTLYYVRVVSIDKGLNRSYDALTTATTAPPDTIAPNAITNLNANTITEKSLILTWNASPSSDVAGYEVYQNGSFMGESNVTSYNVTGLATSTSYEFMVKAKDTSGNVSPGVSATFNTVGDTFAPGVTISPAPGTYTTAKTVTLSVDEPATIYYTTDGSEPTTSSPVYSTPFSISENKTIKYFAKDTAGNQSITKAAVYSIDITPPLDVTNLAASAITETSLTLGWSASASSDIASYDVYRGTTLLGNVATTFYSVTGLTQNTPYTFKVVAKDASGNTSAGVTVGSTTLADTTPPAEATNLQATSITTTGLTLTWTASASSDVASYDVYRGATLLGNTTSTSYPVSGLSSATSYTFTVKAKDGSANISTGTSVTTSTAEPQLEVVASDNFDRADTTSGTIGTAQVGGGWNHQAGYKITGNKLQYISGQTYPKLNTFVSDNFVIQVDIQIPTDHTSTGTICGLAIRCDTGTSSAAIQWGLKSGFAKLGFINTLSGASAAPADVAYATIPGNWYTLKVEVTGGVYKCYANGTLITTYTDAGLTGSTSNNYHGINIFNSTGSIYLDNFKVSKLV